MNKFLSIIIPRFEETEKEIFPLLSSISNQVGIYFDEIEIIIVCDGHGKQMLDKSFLDMFHLQYSIYELIDNKGPGVCRQVGLDSSHGEYVMFCDADDCLHSVGVLGALMKEAKNKVPDILTSQWIEEIQNDDGTYRYITHDLENTWMHGKLFRRAFLKNNHIRFHSNLRVHEDSYFLSIARSLSQRETHLPIVTYVWKYNEKSITRKFDGIYTYNSFPTFIEACCMAHKQLENYHQADMEWKIIQFIFYVYFTLQKEEWNTKIHIKWKEESEKKFKEVMSPYWHYWNNTDIIIIKDIYNTERLRTFGNQIETETIYDWIKRMQ